MATSSGYIYDNSRYIDNHQTHRNVPVFFNHAQNDPSVNGTGCCLQDTTGCCCGIAERSNFCTSIHEEFEKWLRWNQCDDNIHFDDIAVHQLVDENKFSVSCAEATPTKHGCNEPTKLCLYQKGQHGDWMLIPSRRQLAMRFFVETLCTKQGGKMDENGNSLNCQCPVDSDFDGLFCISPKKALGMQSTTDIHKSKFETEDNSVEQLLTMLFVVIIVCGVWWQLFPKSFKWRKTTPRFPRRYSQFLGLQRGSNADTEPSRAPYNALMSTSTTRKRRVNV